MDPRARLDSPEWNRNRLYWFPATRNKRLRARNSAARSAFAASAGLCCWLDRRDRQTGEEQRSGVRLVPFKSWHRLVSGSLACPANLVVDWAELVHCPTRKEGRGFDESLSQPAHDRRSQAPSASASFIVAAAAETSTARKDVVSESHRPPAPRPGPRPAGAMRAVRDEDAAAGNQRGPPAGLPKPAHPRPASDAVSWEGEAARTQKIGRWEQA